MSIWDIIILVFAIILLGIAGGMAAKSAADISENSAISRDSNLSSSRGLLIASTIISFISLLFIVVILILFIVFQQRVTGGTQKLIIGLLMVLVFIMIIISGSLAAAGAAKMHSSSNFTDSGTNKSAYLLAIFTAVILFLGLGFLFFIYMIFFFLRRGIQVAHVVRQYSGPEQLKRIQQYLELAQNLHNPPQQVSGQPQFEPQQVPVVIPNQQIPVHGQPIQTEPMAQSSPSYADLASLLGALASNVQTPITAGTPQATPSHADLTSLLGALTSHAQTPSTPGTPQASGLGLGSLQQFAPANLLSHVLGSGTSGASGGQSLQQLQALLPLLKGLKR